MHPLCVARNIVHMHGVGTCMGTPCSMRPVAWRSALVRLVVAPRHAAPPNKSPSSTQPKGGKGGGKQQPSSSPSTGGTGKQGRAQGLAKTGVAKGKPEAPSTRVARSSSSSKAGAGHAASTTAAIAKDNSGHAWRVFQVLVPYASDPGKDDMTVHEPLRAAVVKRLGCKNTLSPKAITLVRKSFDSRAVINGMKAEKRWVYVVDVDAAALAAAGGAKLGVAPGQLELLTQDEYQPPLLAPAATTVPSAAGSRNVCSSKDSGSGSSSAGGSTSAQAHAAGEGSGVGSADLVQPRLKASHPVVIVGSGPAGLFAALQAAQAGLPVLVLERGQPVEQRGKDIGALLARGVLNPDSNLCYGEGGAGTWSDGKLATKIGRNSDPVRAVLQAFVQFGAPEHILLVGKPHLGTDRLVMMLKHMRHHLLEGLGAQIRFGTSVDDLVVDHGRVTGVRLAGTGEVVRASAVVLSVGHSARKMYRRLHAHDVVMTPKPFAMGFRIEHPQSLIDTARYGSQHAGDVQRGRGRIPVADYKLNVEVADDTYSGPVAGAGRHGAAPQGQRAVVPTGRSTSEVADPQDLKWQEHEPQDTTSATGSSSSSSSSSSRDGRSSSASASQRSDKPRVERGGAGVEEYGGGSGRPVPPGQRGVYSFCMCPGGQIVCTSTSPEELCLNGMSFSRRDSKWANSALVVTTGPGDWAHHEPAHGVLSGIAFQEEMEREAAVRGGGCLVAPVQRVTDFLAGQLSTGTLPSSSYRLGVKSAPLHHLYPPFVSAALGKALQRFERTIPGFMSSPDALLHGIEARTSAPIRIDRDPVTLESVSLAGLYPSGEGAGYAGGIVSAAVDGMKVGQAIVQALVPAAASAQ